MLRYAIYRLIWLIPTILGMTLVVFVLMSRTPGSPFDAANASRALNENEQKALKAKYGLDKPVWQQYLIYVKNASHLDFGDSYVRRGQAVRTIIGRGFKYSFYLGLLAM